MGPSLNTRKPNQNHNNHNRKMKHNATMKQRLSTLGIGALMTTAVLAALGVGSSAHAALVLHYTFDEGSGTSAASSVNSTAANTLRLVGAGTGWSASGKYGSAMSVTSLAGGAGAATTGSWATAAANSDRSMTLWVQLSGGGQFAPSLIGAIDDNTYRHQGIIRRNSANDSVQGFARSAGGTQLVMTDWTSLADSTTVWTHVAMTMDGTTGEMKYYQDGVLKDTTSPGSWDGWGPASELTFAGIANPGYSFTGLYDDARVYDEVLDLAGVQTSMAEIPEPSGTLLIGLGLLTLARRRR